MYLNPPYRHPIVDKFVDKMVKHNNGIALLFDRCDQGMWQDKIFPTASALLFMRGRVKFLNPDGKTFQGAGCGSILIAWGSECAEMLSKCKIDGFFINLNANGWHNPPIPTDKVLLLKTDEDDIGCGYIDDEGCANSTDIVIDNSNIVKWAELPFKD